MIGRLVTVSEIADPFRISRIMGRARASASVRQSRTIWVSSLRVCAMMRLICNPMNSHRGAEKQRRKDREADGTRTISPLSLCLCVSVANSLQTSILRRDFAFLSRLLDDADKDVFHRVSPDTRLKDVNSI